MLWVIVAVVVLGVIFAFGALVGSSIAQTAAGDRARQADRQRRRSAVATRTVVARPVTQP